jgi:hypothetical protein
MSAFLTALGGLGESYGQAGELRRQAGIQNQELDLRKQAADRQKILAQLAQKKAENELVDIGLPQYSDNGIPVRQMWSPSQGKVVQIHGQGGAPTGMEALRDFVKKQDPKYQKDLQAIAESELAIDPNDTKGAMKAVLSRAEKLQDQEEAERKEKAKQDAEDKRKLEGYKLEQDDKGQWWYMPDDPSKSPIRSSVKGKLPKQASGEGDPRSVADKAKDVQSGSATLKDFPTKERGAIATYMRENKMEAKRKLNASEQKTLDIVNQIEPKIGQLKKTIEDAGLTTDNDWMFGGYSSLAEHLRMFAYNRGVAPEKLSGQLIKTAASLQVMGAGPWMALGRGKYMFETIKQHLPSPTDTPQQLYEKAIFLQGIVDEAKGSLGQTESGVPGEVVEQ